MIIKTKDKISDVVRQLNDFQTGKVQFLSTGIDWLDHSLLGGLKPSDVLGICGSSFHGKTFLSERITNHIKKDKSVIHLSCEWELELNKKVVNYLSQELNMSVRDIYNINPDEKLKAKYKEALEIFRGDNLYLQNEPVSPEEFERDVIDVMEKHPNSKIVVTIDNLENVFSTSSSQKSDMDNILQKINILKKRHNHTIFIVLNQLNRDVGKNITDKRDNYPKMKDIHGTAQLEKLSDCLVIIDNAYKRGLEDYMVFNPDHRYLYIDDSFKNQRKGGKTTSFKTMGNLFYHVPKARNIEQSSDTRDLYVEKIFDVPEDKEEEKITEFDY